MSGASPERKTNPRLSVALLAAIVVVQGVFAATLVYGEALESGEPLQLLLRVAFGIYVVLIAAFVFGVWRRLPQARYVGMGAALTGLVIALLQILGGDPIDRHFLGMLIDGALLFYLTRPHVRAFFDA